MMKLRLLLFCFAFGCSNRESVPSGILPKEEMQKILWDIIQADQYSRQYILPDTTKNTREETIRLYNEALEVNHVTKDQFQKSYQFYISRPDLFKTIVDSLSSIGNRHLQEVHQSSRPQIPPKKTK
jgi:hypothetical protein